MFNQVQEGPVAIVSAPGRELMNNIVSQNCAVISIDMNRLLESVILLLLVRVFVCIVIVSSIAYEKIDSC